MAKEELPVCARAWCSFSKSLLSSAHRTIIVVRTTHNHHFFYIQMYKFTDTERDIWYIRQQTYTDKYIALLSVAKAQFFVARNTRNTVNCTYKHTNIIQNIINKSYSWSGRHTANRTHHNEHLFAFATTLYFNE